MSKCTRPNKINHYHYNSTGSLSLKMMNRTNCNLLINHPPPNKNTTIHMKPPLQTTTITTINNNTFDKPYQNCNVRRRHLSPLLSNTLLINNNNSKPSAFNEFEFTITKKSKKPSLSSSKRSFSSTGSFLSISTIFILTILSLVLINHQVYSLNCYHCSSVDNPNCDESFSGKDNFTLPGDTDCYKHIGREAKVCRKIVQYIEHKKVVIRSCGYIDEPTSSNPQRQQGSSNGIDQVGKEKKPMCYKRSGTFAIMMESCNCYTDGCNYSVNLKPTQSVILLSTCLMITYVLASKIIGMEERR